MLIIAYNWGAMSLQTMIDNRLAEGKNYFLREDALRQLGVSPKALIASANRLQKKQRLAVPFRGFYLILRPEDRFSGAPDPECWIAPLMKYLALDYRISLLRAAEYHGVSHQAGMVFQVIAPRQLRPIQIGGHKIQFIFQSPRRFTYLNKFEWLVQMKSSSGFAKVAGIELTLFDCSRYLRKAAGIDYVAQIVKGIGGRADSIKLSALATSVENTTLRRLGYLLDHMGHHDQAAALLPFVGRAKSFKPLDPSVIDLPDQFAPRNEINCKWKLFINHSLATDY